MDKLTKFGRDKAGYTTTKKVVTNKYADLFLDGALFRSNLPFPLIEYERAKLLRQGYTSKRVVVKYHQQ